jgi:hypothetical protein
MKHMDRTDVADNIKGELRAFFMKDVERKVILVDILKCRA